MPFPDRFGHQENRARKIVDRGGEKKEKGKAGEASIAKSRGTRKKRTGGPCSKDENAKQTDLSRDTAREVVQGGLGGGKDTGEKPASSRRVRTVQAQYPLGMDFRRNARRA